MKLNFVNFLAEIKIDSLQQQQQVFETFCADSKVVTWIFVEDRPTHVV